MADYEQFQFGSVQFPLELNATPIDEFGDPPLFTVLEYIKFCLQKYLGDRWDAEFADFPELVGNIVAEDVNYDPTYYFQQAQYTLPLLALYRTKSEVFEKTAVWYATRSEWQLLYVFEPVKTEQIRKVSTFLQLIANVITDRIEQGYDPGYKNGELIFETAGISKIKVVDFSTYQQAQNTVETNLDFKVLVLNLEVEELEEKNPGLDNLEGADGYVTISDSQTEVDFIEFQKDLI